MLYFLILPPSMVPVVRAAKDVISPAVYSPRRPPPPTRGTQNMYAGICRNRGEISRQGDITLRKAIRTLYNWPVAKGGKGYSEDDGQLGILAHRTNLQCALMSQPPVRIHV